MGRQGYLLLIGGVPGTGKTVIGARLSPEYGCLFRETSKIAEDLALQQPDPTGRRTFYVDSPGIRAIASYLRDLASRSKCVIAATPYPESLLPLLETHIPLAIILRTHPLVLYQRLQKRKWPRDKILENIVAEALNYYTDALWDWRDMIIEVDTTGLNPNNAVQIIVDKIHRWDTGFSIDWLADERVLSELSKWLRELDFYKDRLS